MDGAMGSRLTPREQLQLAREVLTAEGQALLDLADGLGDSFLAAVELVLAARGAVIVTGMGKAGLIGQKIVATLASTGTRSHFLHPGEAVHGDLGRIGDDDVVLLLSQSGETEEVVRLLSTISQLGAAMLAITASEANTLGRAADVVIALGKLTEACPLGLAPSTSTTAMAGVGDALALVLSRCRGFGEEDFARFHPAGSLGRKLSLVTDHMRPLAECRICREEETVREVLVSGRRDGRRSGAVMVVDARGALRGVFTDSDLARLLENRRDELIDQPMATVMTHQPATVSANRRMVEAIALLRSRKLSELPVVDANDRPLGLLDVTDVVGWQAAGDAAGPGAKAA